MTQASTLPDDLVAEVIRHRRGVIFCGAGISVDAPASLPSWTALRDNTLEAVASRDSYLHKYLDHLTKCSTFRSSDTSGLSPELVASKLSALGNGYFESFRVLESGEPNQNHRHLADLAKAGFLKFIITTNFDLFIEAALDEQAVPYRAYRSAEEFHTFEPDSAGVHLLKLHGCISYPTTITATVEQEGKGLTPEKCKALETLLLQHTFVFWGYSGQDLKIDIDYLRMMTVRGRAKGFVWSFHQSGSFAETPNRYVLQLREAYGERGQIGHGILPNATQTILPIDRSYTRKRLSPSEQMTLAERKGLALKQALFDWAAKHLSPIEACYAFAQLLMEAGRLDESMHCQAHVLNLATDAKDMLWKRTVNLRMSDIHQEMGNLAEAYQCAAEARRIAESIREKWVLSLPLERLAAIHVLWGQYDKALAYLDDAKSSMEPTDHSGRSRVLSERAKICLYQGRPEEALRAYEEAAEILTARGDKLALAVLWNDMGQIHFTWGEFDVALDYFAKSEEIDIAHNRKSGIAFSRHNIATVHIARDEYEKATVCLEQAREIAMEVGNEGLLAGILSSQAGICLKEERYSDALSKYQHAATAFRSMGEKRKLGSVLANIAAVHNLQSEYDLAVETYREALAELGEIGANFWSASICGFVGEILADSLDNPKDALTYFQRSIMYYRKAESFGEIPEATQRLVRCRRKALGLPEVPFDSLLTESSRVHSVLETALTKIASALGVNVNPFSIKNFCEALVATQGRQSLESIVLHQLAALGQTARSDGDLVFSVRVLNAGCHIAAVVGDLQMASLMANESGLALSDAGAHEQAAEAFEEGAKASRVLGDEYELVTRLNNKARSYLSMHDPNRAAEVLSRAEKHARRLPSSDQLIRVLNSLSECRRMQGKTSKAIAYYEELKSIASQNGDFKTEIASLMGIGTCYRDEGQHRRSVEYRKQALVIAESTQDGDLAGHLSALIANTFHRELDEPGAALPFYEKAIAYLQKVGQTEMASELARRSRACEMEISEA